MFDIQDAPEGKLYDLQSLIYGFRESDTSTIFQTSSFHQYQAYYPLTRPGARDLPELQKVVRHDAAITDALRAFLAVSGKRTVGIMGGHSARRDETAYKDVARLARELTRNGFLIMTGGGPGIMEAGHVGAFFAFTSPSDFEEALDLLGSGRQKKYPSLHGNADVLNPDGSLSAAVTNDNDYRDDLHAWFTEAYRLKSKYEGRIEPGVSLAVPTWQYGHELAQPFATWYADFFLDSLREAALIGEASAGIVYARGGGGTLREIFADVEENYYAKSQADFTPMIFFDRDDYWSRESDDRSTIKIDDVIRRTFTKAFGAPPNDERKWSEKVRFTNDVPAILKILGA